MSIQDNENTISALLKLVDYVASGIGSVAGSMLAPWKAKQEAKAMQISAQGDADKLLIQAEAQSKAKEILLSEGSLFSGEIDISDAIDQRIHFQETRKQQNIESVVMMSAEQLGNEEVPNNEPDHDWTAHFFNHVQNISSTQMQVLWAKILSSEVRKPRSTSIRTIGILKDMDQEIAKLFEKYCSCCAHFGVGEYIQDARVISIGGNAGSNSLAAYGLEYTQLNRLNEYGLIISDYNSWRDYQSCIGVRAEIQNLVIKVPFQYQGKYWILETSDNQVIGKEFKLHGVAMTAAGLQISRVVNIQENAKYTEDLLSFFTQKGVRMVEVSDNNPQLFHVKL